MRNDTSRSPWRHRRAIGAALLGAAIAAAVLVGVAVVPSLASGPSARHGSPTPILQEHKAAGYGEVLTDSAGYTLYVLSTESSGKLHCTSGACLKAWPPLLVAKNAKVTGGAGVRGKISHVVRGAKWQVTYNGWPVYTFVGDSHPGQTNGENIHAFGGVWDLVHAAATTNAATPIKKAAGSGPGATPVLQERKVASYGEVLTDSAGYTLYVLSTESSGKLHCTSVTCLKLWPALEVAKNTKVTGGTGVKGKISHVVRGAKWQVTYNGWPVYTFIKDSHPGQAYGEGIHAFGGVWYAVRASATSNAATPIKKAASSGTTTTTAPSGGYGY